MSSLEGGAPAHIVVVHSDVRHRRVLSWLLRERGYTVTDLDDRDAILERLQGAEPDLVLLQAGHDGRGPTGERLSDAAPVLRRLRADQRLEHVPVVVTAPADIPDAAAASLRLGASDCVTEPLRVDELLARIETQLRSSAAIRRARAQLREREVELARARDDVASTQELVAIVHEVAGEFSATAMYRILARRVAHALHISHCSVVLATVGDTVGTVVAAHEDPEVGELTIDLERYPEIRLALETGKPVLVEDVRVHPLLEQAREHWAREGRPIRLQSVITLPFTLDRSRQGVLFLRTESDGRTLTQEDCGFAEVALHAAISSIKRGQVVERTREDNRRLAALATTDPLTQLFNRRAFLERLTVELDRARRYGHTLSLLVVDVDHFKQINDTAGHLAGDRVLGDIGGMLQRAVRAVDLVARYGGEEFVVLLPETPLEGAVLFAERLRELLERQMFVGRGDEVVQLTVSVGVATFPATHVHSADDLFARADEALYRAKQQGRNKVCS